MTVADVYASVSEAAGMLDVHPQRIYKRIRDGSLPAMKVGNQLLIERGDLHRLQHSMGPGRPLSSKSVQNLLLVAANPAAAADLSPSARSRARSRLRDLIAHAASEDLEMAAAHVVHAMRNRAVRRLFAASSRDLADLRDDKRVHLSGISLSESNVSAGEAVEGYVSEDDLDAVVEDYLLSKAPPSQANVVLHVAAAESIGLLGEMVDSPLMIAADLAEHDGVREKNEALRLLSSAGDGSRG